MTRRWTGCRRRGRRSPAGTTAARCCADGRVLLVPWSATAPLIYDPQANTMTVSAASTPLELQTGADFTSGQLLGDGRVLLVPNLAPGALVYDPAADSLAPVAVELGGASCGSGVLLADGRVLLPINYGEGRTVIFDPLTDTITVTAPPSAAGMFGGGALLADGSVLLLPGVNSDLMDCRIWEPETDTYVAGAGVGGGAGDWAGGVCGWVRAAGWAGGVYAVLFTAFGGVGAGAGGQFWARCGAGGVLESVAVVPVPGSLPMTHVVSLSFSGRTKHMARANAADRGRDMCSAGCAGAAQGDIVSRRWLRGVLAAHATCRHWSRSHGSTSQESRQTALRRFVRALRAPFPTGGRQTRRSQHFAPTV